MDKEKEFELVKKFIQGDESAFNKLIHYYKKLIYWHARRMVGNHLDADEVTQQVIIVLFKKLNTFKFNSTLKTWIYRITQTRCLNLIRKQKVRQFLNFDDNIIRELNSDEDIILNYDDKEKLEMVNNALNKLPIKQREVFIFRHFDELNYEEISDITGKSVGGLKANYYHASKKILEMTQYET
jgi:RNA polymerase sigma-70 factor (ECF subfamily)